VAPRSVESQSHRTKAGGCFTPEEESELRRLVGQTFDLRDGPYYTDGLKAIETWFDRRHVRRLEIREERTARLVNLLRETDPVRRRVAA
jgi:hypothetical protein